MRKSTLGALLIVVSACGSTHHSSELASLAQLQALPGSTVDDALASKVLGTYAVRTRLATNQKLPILGNASSLSSTYSLVSIVRSGEGLAITERACHIDIVSSSPVLQTVPDALTQSIEVQTAPFRIWQEANTVSFAKDPVAVALGAKLIDAEKEALPTNVDDARVWDQDADGHPGVTVKVSGKLVSGEIYLVQRLKNTWNGTLDASGILSGLYQDQGEQSILDASSAILKGKVAITVDPDASKSNVLFARLGEGYDCEKLAAETSVLFPK